MWRGPAPGLKRRWRQLCIRVVLETNRPTRRAGKYRIKFEIADWPSRVRVMHRPRGG